MILDKRKINVKKIDKNMFEVTDVNTGISVKLISGTSLTKAIKDLKRKVEVTQLITTL